MADHRLPEYLAIQACTASTDFSQLRIAVEVNRPGVAEVLHRLAFVLPLAEEQRLLRVLQDREHQRSQGHPLSSPPLPDEPA